MTGIAGLVGLGWVVKLIAAAGGVAVHAVELAGERTGTARPGGLGVVFPEITTVRVKIRVLVGNEVVVVEIAVPGRKRTGEWHGLGVAGGAQVVLLGVAEIPATPDEL